MIILDGKKLSEEIRNELKLSIQNSKYKRVPHLVVILVGNNSASEIYVNNKKKACEKVGIKSTIIKYEENIKEDTLLSKINEMNNDNNVDGILVQLPLPKHIDDKLILNSISSKKDVDGFHPINVGNLNLNYKTIKPCTPLGIIKILKHYKIPLKGKDVIVIGSSNIVGKPLSTMLLNEKATVTTCHKDTKDLKKHTINADILIVATGVANLVKEDMVKNNVVVVDVGISRINNKLYGDVDFENVSKKASHITPVPGGVGPMTIATLLTNTYDLFIERMKENG